MRKIEQTFAWSASRVKTLRDCMWKYYLHYCMSWEGWLPSVPQEKQQAYMMKNMTNIPMWAGSIVHDIIETIIRDARSTGKWMSLKDAQSQAVQRLRKGWVDSTKQRWQASAKNYINLEEHYYQMRVGKDYTDSYKTKVLSCLHAFYTCPLFNVIRNLTKDDWLSLEDFQKFQMNTGEEVTVKIDCGFRHNGKVYLLDWKTGKVANNVIDQLVVYAMYAIKMGWAEKPEDILIVPVYLAAFVDLGANAMPELNVTIDMMKRQAGIVRTEYPLLKNAFDNKDSPDFFSRTDDEYKCKRCQFRGMCDGAQTEISDSETPF